ncbi:MAG: hypothetical protein EBZ87_01460, partial [Microbacteriaceae bacterium]|nr:hypothetical protein [Microbacteriaceae bacterium]
MLLALLPSTGYLTPATISAYAVEADQDTSLSSFLANGSPVSDGATVNLAQGSTSINIEASTTDIFAEAVTSANADDLAPGSNTVTVTVTAADGETVQVYTLYVEVAEPSSDTAISEVLVNGEAFTGALDGTGIYQAPVGTTQVTVVATPSSPAAQVAYFGNTDLVEGSENTVTIQVTAENGDVASYTFNVNVAAANTNTDLSTFTVDSWAVADGYMVLVPYGTTEVTVIAETAAATSTYTYTGNTGLITGDNYLTLTVTSEAGTTYSYQVVVRVAEPSSDKTYSSITVDGETLDSYWIDVPTGTTSVDVVVALNSLYATSSVAGNTALYPGENTVIVTITSQDGVSTQISFTVNVYIPSSNSLLQSLSVDGNLIAVNDVVTVPNGTSSVAVSALALDPKATVVVTGNSSLSVGSNSVTVTVTAEDGSNSTYTFTVLVSLSTNTAVTSITIDGVDRTSNYPDSQTTAKLANSVAVEVVTEDADASYTVSGASPLTPGENNTITITVTAPSGDTTTYVRYVYVPSLSSNTGIVGVMLDGVTFNLYDEPFYFPNGTTSIDVLVVLEDETASYVVDGNSGLTTGGNIVGIIVTAENGDQTYTAFEVVVAQSSNTGIVSLTIDGVDRTSSSSEVQTTPKAATSVVVAVVTEDVDSTFVVSGDQNLSTGTNVITVIVTAPDGSTETYERSVSVPVLSSNTALSSLTVDGVVVA